jgi:hypothetical protein
MPRSARPPGIGQHAPENAMEDPGEIARFHDRCSDLMRELLDALAEAPGRPRTFPQIEDSIAWPRRRIASVLGGVSHLRQTEFGGRRPYRFLDGRRSASGRWELWMDAAQATAVRDARRAAARRGGEERGTVARRDSARGGAVARLRGGRPA